MKPQPYRRWGNSPKNLFYEERCFFFSSLLGKGKGRSSPRRVLSYILGYRIRKGAVKKLVGFLILHSARCRIRFLSFETLDFQGFSCYLLFIFFIFKASTSILKL
jgi:hypothetical protein